MALFEVESNSKTLRNPSAITVGDILRFITPEEEFIFDKYENDSNASSDLSDPFSDNGGRTTFQDFHKKRLSKLEADIQLMSSFSKSFLQVQDEVRKEMMLSQNICAEDLLNIQPQEKKFHEDADIIELAEKLIENCGLDTMVLEKKKEVKAAAPTPTTFFRFSKGDVETNSQSAIWRMLEADTDEQGFPLSPIGYNIYMDKKHDWLSRHDLNWDEKESSKNKCESWLKKNEMRLENKKRESFFAKPEKKVMNFGKWFLNKKKDRKK